MTDSPILALIFLIGSSLMTGVATALQRIGKAQAELIAKNQIGLGKFLFKKNNRDLLSYAITLTKNALLICFTITAFDTALRVLSDQVSIETFILSLLIVLGAFLISDYAFRILSILRPRSFFKVTCQ